MLTDCQSVIGSSSPCRALRAGVAHLSSRGQGIYRTVSVLDINHGHFGADYIASLSLQKRENLQIAFFPNSSTVLWMKKTRHEFQAKSSGWLSQSHLFHLWTPERWLFDSSTEACTLCLNTSAWLGNTTGRVTSNCTMNKHNYCDSIHTTKDKLYFLSLCLNQ